MADRFTAVPTLVIGLGGTGLKIATFVKKSLMEANQNQRPDRMAILVLDTEQKVIYKAGGWGQKREEQHATGPVSIEGGEYVPLVGNLRPLVEKIRKEQKEARVQPEARRHQSLRHINTWFQAEYYLDKAVVKDNVWNLNEGAGRYRQFGRLGLLKNFQTITTMLGGALQYLKNMGADRVYVHVTGSLAGGTGAALFIDVAHLVRQLAHTTVGFNQTPVIFGHFVLPEAFRGTPAVQIDNPGVKADFDARAYAALRELTRLQGQTVKTTGGYPLVYNPNRTAEFNSRLEDAPYTAVYLYDGQRERNPLNTLKIEDGLAPAVADAVAAYIDDLSGGTFCSHVVNYDSFKAALRIPTGAVTYGSLGTYTIELPIYHLTEKWTYDLAKDVLDTLLQPGDFDDRGFPISLTTDQPGGLRRSPKGDVTDWLKREPSSLVGLLAEWGRVVARTSVIFQQKVDEILNYGTDDWLQQLAPSDAAWRNYVAEADAELKGSLKDKTEPKYFVDYRQPGNSAEQRAENLINEVDVRLNQMLGKIRDGWLREGGDFRRALERLVYHHVAVFDDQLITWLKITLNGQDAGSVSQGKQGKLGYAKAFIQELEQILQICVKILQTAAEQSRHKRYPRYVILENHLKEIAATMRQRSGFRNSNLRKYRDIAGELSQFQKADITREVVTDVSKRLRASAGQILEELELWERILALANTSDGGIYRLVVEGQSEIAVDRELSKSADRWVIEDDEPSDTYLSDKQQEYSAGAAEQVLKLVTWDVVRAGPDLKSPIRVNFKMGYNEWDRLAGASGQRRRGLENLRQLLAECRQPFEQAWDNMSVTAYLEYNYKSRVDELAAKIYQHSGFMLETTTDAPMCSTYMRVYKDGLGISHENFLRRLRSEVAVAFKESVVADREGEAADSGEPSRDPFKLTFVMFGDLLQPHQITGIQKAQDNYRRLSAAGEGWRTLHVLPAETNALQIECNLSSGGRDAQQRRELSEEVVVTLEDIDRFRLAMRCLAYGETDYDWGPDWGLHGRRGLLLHKHTPREDNPRGLSYWRLTLIPPGKRRSDGRFYDDRGRLAEPRTYQLSESANEPDLLQAFVQLVCVGRELRNNVELDWRAVEETVRHMMRRHAQQWLNKEMGWQPKGRTANDAHLLDEAQDKAAQMIRLQALIEEAKESLNKYRWAWIPGGEVPGELRKEAPDKVRDVQKFVDFWTAIAWEAQQEFSHLDRRFQDLAEWRSAIPLEGLSMNRHVAQNDGSWICPDGHINRPNHKFCTQCGAPRPEPLLCVNGHKMPLGANFCPECGQPARKSQAYSLSPTLAFNPIIVGQIVELKVILLPNPTTEETFRLPATESEIHCFISADGLHIRSSEAKPITFDPVTHQPLPVSFELEAQLRGDRPYTVELFVEDLDTGRVSIVQSKGYLTVLPPDTETTPPPTISPLDVRVAPQPDFTLRVTTALPDGEGSDHHLSYHLSSRLPGLRYQDQAVGEVRLTANDLRRIRKLLHHTLHATRHHQPEDSRERMLSVGAYLFDQLFPAESAAPFRDALRQADGMINTWLFIEAGLTWLPWEILVPPPVDTNSPSRFLSERYRLSRWVEGLGPSLYSEVPVGEIALAHYKSGTPAELAHDEALVGWQKLLSAQNNSYGILPVVKPETPIYGLHLLRYLDEMAGFRELVPREANSDSAVDIMEEEIPRARLDLRLKRPVVTLGMIAGDDSESQPLPDGWLLPERVYPFLRAGASAVSGPWWPTTAAADRIYWSTFYDLLLRRVTLGEAAWRARLAAKRAHPHRLDWLAYTLFGDPRAQPYWPEASEGYTALECLNPDEPLRFGKTYYFRASIRRRPPIWYQDRLIQAEELPQQPHALFLAPDLQATFPEPIAMTPFGRTMVQATVPLTPTDVGEYLLTVRLFAGEERLQSLQLNLVVGEPNHSGDEV